MKKFFVIAACMISLVSCNVTKSGLVPKNFVSEYEGRQTGLYVLENKAGMEVCVTNFGGRIVSIMAPDQEGGFRDVVLGFNKVSDYFPENNSSDFGAAIGRYANRIAKGHLCIDGNEYQLPLNNGENTLHGGFTGWQYKVYDVVESDSSHIKLLMDSPDGDNNFPGNVKAYVTYTLTEDNKLDIVYEAETDAPTVINMTNHSYFNLSGDPANHSIINDELIVYADMFTPTDEGLIPTGEMRPVEGTPMDFRFPQTVGDRIDIEYEPLTFAGGIDHNWVLNTNCDDTKVAAVFHCDETGICLTVRTNEPGIQVYAGNFLDGTVMGKHRIFYPKRSALCLETQHFPDSPNHEEWPSVVLRPGEKYYSHCVFEFSVVDVSFKNNPFDD